MSALDRMSELDAEAALRRCCGAGRWVTGMLAARPYGDATSCLEAAREVWATMERPDILEAFDHHPRIGASLERLREKFGDTAGLSASEQSAVASANEDTLTSLRDANVAYEARYGHIFIVCASGKTAAEMLEILRGRMGNEPEHELKVAAAEQMKITELRLAASWEE